MSERWILNLCPLLHFDNSRVHDYEHNISIASWNLKNVIDYVDMHPSHKFCIDQVSLLEGFKRLFPNYWDALRQKILEGRVELVGGTYVQPDLTIPDGESIARQFLYANRFILHEIGLEPRTGWGIDSSTHCLQLPQILRLCGIDSYFMWRGMPYDGPSEFIWQGADGSRVYTVWLSQGYDCAAWLSENARDAFWRLLDITASIGSRSVSKNILIPVGGELVPPLPHLADIVDKWNSTFPDMRAVIVIPREFIDKVKLFQTRLPVIRRALDMDRFTSVRSGSLSARVTLKMLSRRLEGLLYMVEVHMSQAGRHDKNLELESLWRILLFNHDHNIIRGTIADEPFRQAKRRFEQAIEQATELLNTTVTEYFNRHTIPSDTISLVVMNPLAWTRSDVVSIVLDRSIIKSEHFEIRDLFGVSIPYQSMSTSSESARESESGSKNLIEVIFVAHDIPSLGHKTYTIVPTDKVPEFTSSIRTGQYWIESDQFIIEFDPFNGSITRLYSKSAHIESLRGNSNYFSMETDVGDLYRFVPIERIGKDDGIQTTLKTPAKIQIIESGPVRAIIEVTGESQGVRRRQRIRVYHGIDRVELDTELEYTGRASRLRLCYPLTVFTDIVHVGAQFCTEARLISHQCRSSSDVSESFAALDWVDCTGPDGGITIITPGLHEFEFSDGSLFVTLLRSVDHLSRGHDDYVIQTPLALENGHHTFRTAIYPHMGSWQEARVWRPAWEHRLPLLCLVTEGTPDVPEASMMQVEGAQLILSCFKPTDKEKEFIVRLYEAAGVPGHARIKFNRPLVRADLVDICEREIGGLAVDGTDVEIPIDRNSIITMRIAFE